MDRQMSSGAPSKSVEQSMLIATYRTFVLGYCLAGGIYYLAIAAMHLASSSAFNRHVLGTMALTSSALCGLTWWSNRKTNSGLRLEAVTALVTAILVVNTTVRIVSDYQIVQLGYIPAIAMASAIICLTRRVLCVNIAIILVGVWVAVRPADMADFVYVLGAGVIGSIALFAVMRQAIGHQIAARVKAETLGRQLEEAVVRNRELADDATAASEAKSLFLATMSHEIRTPLNGVLGMAQAMAGDELSAVQRGRLDVVRQSGQSLLTILNDILDLSKIEAGKLEIESTEFDLNAVAEGAYATFEAIAGHKGVGFNLEVAPEAVGAYLGDPTRLRQVLCNLISNALKFTEAGEVRIAIHWARDDVGGRLCMVVRDTGIGMTPEQTQNLFQKFVQADASTNRRFGGTGLGLAICGELVKRMGGEISIDSEAGHGSTFTVTLPLERIAGHKAAEAAAAARAPTGVRVLAADDNEVNRLVLKTLLEQVGVETVLADNGRSALEAWEAGAWDLVLMDIHMPVMDGVEATAAIRRREAQTGRARTPIIALTADAMSHQVDAFLAQGFDGHVSKPIEIGQLLAAMEAALADGAANEDIAAAG
jgi:signal transduction histidine kinase/AmiR/NasT family two-component response regulator